ncbi:MAG: hypothetical protein P1P85_00880 [Patescibacteria group bacterium]|nr:hypothetical protein [Patescibacteria group bacterium]
MLKLKKEGEGFFELILNIFMPIWLPIRAIQIMVRDMREEKRRRIEEDKK